MQTCSLFIKWFSALHLNTFALNVFNKRHKAKVLFRAFDYAKQCFFTKMQLVYKKTVSKKVKQELSVK